MAMMAKSALSWASRSFSVAAKFSWRLPSAHSRKSALSPHRQWGFAVVQQGDLFRHHIQRAHFIVLRQQHSQRKAHISHSRYGYTHALLFSWFGLLLLIVACQAAGLISQKKPLQLSLRRKHMEPDFLNKPDDKRRAFPQNAGRH